MSLSLLIFGQALELLTREPFMYDSFLLFGQEIQRLFRWGAQKESSAIITRTITFVTPGSLNSDGTVIPCASAAMSYRVKTVSQKQGPR